MHDRGWPSFREALVPGLNSAGLERLRLDRLQELRAIIDSLRLERSLAAHDPYATDAARRS